jgi:hypothetical protein
MSNIETAEIIQFAAIRPKLAKGERPKPKSGFAETLSSLPRDEEGLTETAKNLHLRRARYDAWREADAAMDYWNIAMKMHNLIQRVQVDGLPEGELHDKIDHAEFHPLAKKWREAWSRLILTPAPDTRCVTWKKTQLKSRNQRCAGLPIARIEQAIADDIAFLKAHPTRRKDLPQ